MIRVRLHETFSGSVSPRASSSTSTLPTARCGSIHSYRYLFAQRGSLNDAPVVKALLFLLTHRIFEGAHLGSKDKDNIALWRACSVPQLKRKEEMRSE